MSNICVLCHRGPWDTALNLTLPVLPFLQLGNLAQPKYRLLQEDLSVAASHPVPPPTSQPSKPHCHTSCLFLFGLRIWTG